MPNNHWELVAAPVIIRGSIYAAVEPQIATKTDAVGKG